MLLNDWCFTLYNTVCEPIGNKLVNNIACKVINTHWIYIGHWVERSDWNKLINSLKNSHKFPTYSKSIAKFNQNEDNTNRSAPCQPKSRQITYVLTPRTSPKTSRIISALHSKSDLSEILTPLMLNTNGFPACSCCCCCWLPVETRELFSSR